ncbi:nicotinate-nucleotide adenylyltransferase [Aidingimonas halophila]|uniref:Probable nicotinate-nucleotide adenylyltransferase n=2 Tax=Aidingimonas halophila TaxID=574349 RepID=A0A1H3B034_9GAMM|nr:nicotinate-nucleotide adenylyltransferase [Aidingimonas halophila]
MFDGASRQVTKPASTRVAMFGGTYDPVHIGHLRSAVELREALMLDHVHMVPAHVPPHRNDPAISGQSRLEMLRLGIGDTPGLIADDRELSRNGPSYSVDTLACLREAYGDGACLIMAVGHDAFLKLAQWHRPERLFELANLVVIDRPGHTGALPHELVDLIRERMVETPEALMASPAGRVLRMALSTALPISATDIRARCRRGESIRYLVPDAVASYLEVSGAYRE